jgi:hypothetical protein
VHRQGILLLAITLLASLADASPPAADIKGLVSIADGAPFTLIRGEDLRKGTKGVSLFAGDIVETGPDAFLVIELQGGSLIGIGPSSEVYFLPHSGMATLVVLEGWLKADIRTEAKTSPVRILGTRLGIQCQHAVVLFHADDRSDTIFDEQGSGTLLLRETAATSTDKETRQNQFFVREGHSATVQQPRPSADFLAQMPIAFRDTLPEKASAGLKTPPEPQPLRKVTYVDIQTWLTMPRDWRAGFITRFRSRLRDPAFFSAMDAQLALHPEWVPILHPKPSDQSRPGAGSPQGTTTVFP